MPIPKFSDFFKVFLEAVKDGKLHTSIEVRESIAQKMNLKDEDRTEMLPSGKQSTYDNRVAWARTYLNKAGLINTPLRGQYQITDEGLKALASGAKIDLTYLEQYEKFKQFHSSTVVDESENKAEEKLDESPMEILDAAFKQVNSTLVSQLMDEIMQLKSTEFEKLVVKLLLRMGYGNGFDNAGVVTQASKDGGIDGIIKEDQLGFSAIYIQAKQWADTQTVDRPEIQKFVGALAGKQAQKGLFITTTKFSNEAIDYARNLLGQKVVLVDGNNLARLMIKHNLGVSVEHVYEVKRVDSDFFADEL